MRQKFYTVLRNQTKTVIVVPDNTPVVALQTGDRRPFFMIDSYFFFLDVVKLMGKDQPVLSLIIQEDTQSTDAYSIPDEAAAHVKSILAHQPRGPYMLGGCSASGTVAYETAQQLRALGHEVGLLVLFDTPNWSTPEDPHVWQSLVCYREELNKLHWTEYPGWAMGKVRGLLDRKARVRLDLSTGVSQKVDEPLPARAQAAGEYRPAPYAGRFLLVKRTRLTGRDLYPSFGWSGLVQKIDVCKVSSIDHLEIFKAESDHMAVAQALNKAIDEVNKECSSRSYSARPQKEAVGGVPVGDALISSDSPVTVGTLTCTPRVV